MPTQNRRLNDISKIIRAVFYAGLLVAFVVPAVNNIRRARHFVDTTAIRSITTITASKITFAIVVLIVTVIMSLADVFGAYFWIQFTVVCLPSFFVIFQPDATTIGFLKVKLKLTYSMTAKLRYYMGKHSRFSEAYGQQGWACKRISQETQYLALRKR